MSLLRKLRNRRRRWVDAVSDMPDPCDEVAQRMHEEFVRPDYIDRLAAFHELGPGDPLTREHFASFDTYRLDAARRDVARRAGGDGGGEPGGS